MQVNMPHLYGCYLFQYLGSSFEFLSSKPCISFHNCQNHNFPLEWIHINQLYLLLHTVLLLSTNLSYISGLNAICSSALNTSSMMLHSKKQNCEIIQRKEALDSFSKLSSIISQFKGENCCYNMEAEFQRIHKT